jgi:hypothetical protein
MRLNDSVLVAGSTGRKTQIFGALNDAFLYLDESLIAEDLELAKSALSFAGISATENNMGRIAKLILDAMIRDRQ